MKKFLIWISMIICVFGLTACGSEDKLAEYEQYKLSRTEYEQYKLSQAEVMASQVMVPLLEYYADMDINLDDFTMDEIQYEVANAHDINVDGYAFYSAVDSFRSAADSVGKIQSIDIDGVICEIDGKQIIAEVEVIGEKKNAVAEVVLSNDMFYKLESASLNPSSTMGELMVGAALNTLIGMGTVFAVLILISGIISCFRVISKLQNRTAEKKAAKSTVQQNAGVDDTVTQIAAQEETLGDDDLELAAVIAAAIAAYEGSASTDGFVVRSIRRLR